MSEWILICKSIASVAMSAAITFAIDKTGNENCLWALFFVAAIW